MCKAVPLGQQLRCHLVALLLLFLLIVGMGQGGAGRGSRGASGRARLRVTAQHREGVVEGRQGVHGVLTQQERKLRRGDPSGGEGTEGRPAELAE